MQHTDATQHIAASNAIQKISLFIGILGCLVLAVNF